MKRKDRHISYFNFELPGGRDSGKEIDREYLVVNSLGAYSSSTLQNLNTRKYHGLFVAPQPQLGSDNYVLLSSLDETLVFSDKKFDLGLHQYPGILGPEEYLLPKSLSIGKIPVWVYTSEKFEVEKSLLLLPGVSRLLLRYKVLRAKEQVDLKFTPFLAFRNLHHLRKCNEEINEDFDKAAQGIRVQPYPQFDPLIIQFSQDPEVSGIAEWYYNIEYKEERLRGYDFREDLFVPFTCEIQLQEGDQIIVSIAAEEDARPEKLSSLFDELLLEKKEITSFSDALATASESFVIHQMGSCKVVAGWHWFGSWGRDTFISLPGLYLGSKDLSLTKKILSDAILNLKDGLFSNVDYGAYLIYNSVDAPLWFCWALQKIRSYAKGDFEPWTLYGGAIKQILNSFRNGTRYGICMTPEGLIRAGEKGLALTWMDAIVGGKAVTPRIGMPVEINALWYNAVNFALELAMEAGDLEFAEAWKSLPMVIRNNFQQNFWDENRGYLADVVDGEARDFSIRPNMLMAISLPYSPLKRHMGTSIVGVLKKELLTSRGLRTLSRNDPAYIGKYTGNQEARDKAYHQGSVWPWLVGQYTEAALKVDPTKNLPELITYYANFENTLWEHGVGSVSEIFDGDEPHLPRGAISQAWSVAELIRTGHMLTEYQKAHGPNKGKQIN